MSQKPNDPENPASEPMTNEAATQAAAQAAAALSQLAAALSTAKLPFGNLHSSRHILGSFFSIEGRATEGDHSCMLCVEGNVWLCKASCLEGQR